MSEMWKYCKGYSEEERSPMLISFNKEPHNVEIVKCCESCRKFEETPMLVSFYNEPQIVETENAAKVVESLKKHQYYVHYIMDHTLWELWKYC